jgi:hypothetical protein
MPLEIRSGKHPHEVALLIAALLGGVCGLLFFSTLASTTIRALPVPFGHILYGGLAAGAGIALVGVFSNGARGARTECIGLWFMSGHCAAYAVGIYAAAGPGGTLITGFMVAFGVANLVRAVQIGNELEQMEAARIVLGVRDRENGP